MSSILGISETCAIFKISGKMSCLNDWFRVRIKGLTKTSIDLLKPRFKPLQTIISQINWPMSPFTKKILKTFAYKGFSGFICR